MAADAFALLADPTRRRMVELLAEDERSVGELVAEVGIHQPGVSRHLRILHEAGFVSVRRDAQRRIYALRPEALQEVDDWVARYRGLWEQRFDKLAAHLARQQAQQGRREPPPDENRRDAGQDRRDLEGRRRSDDTQTRT